MSQLFPNFVSAASHARESAASSDQVVGVFVENDQWTVQPLDENPAEWLQYFESQCILPESAPIELFVEYEAANDDTYA